MKMFNSGFFLQSPSLLSVKLSREVVQNVNLAMYFQVSYSKTVEVSLCWVHFEKNRER
jgi:hypothetical protein